MCLRTPGITLVQLGPENWTQNSDILFHASSERRFLSWLSQLEREDKINSCIPTPTPTVGIGNRKKVDRG